MTDDEVESLFLNFGMTEEDGLSILKEPCKCSLCKEVFIYAVPNQKDGTFKCYYCRTYC
jgi:hypothetical protein